MVAEQYSLNQTLPEIIQHQLKPLVRKIDEEAYYPTEFFQGIGEAGLLYGQGGQSKDILFDGLHLVETISGTCMTTGFALWCHLAALIYVRNSKNTFLQNTILPKLEEGQIRGGTGLSNPLKQIDGLEKLCLKAQRVSGGYVISGRVPFISNIGRDAWFACIACEEDGHKFMAMVPGDADNLTLQEKRDFLGLNGCATCACTFDNVFVPDAWIIAEDAEDFVAQVRSTFLLYQIPLAFGVTEASINWIERTRHKQGGCNRYLPVQAADIANELQALRERTYQLVEKGDLSDKWLDLLQIRLDATYLTSKATHVAMVHHGGSGYLRHSDSFRRLRESYFLVSLTPTVRHLEKVLQTDGVISA